MQSQTSLRQTKHSLAYNSISYEGSQLQNGTALIIIVSGTRTRVYHVPLIHLDQTNYDKITSAHNKIISSDLEASIAGWLFDPKFVPNYEIVGFIEFLDYAPSDHGLYSNFLVSDQETSLVTLSIYYQVWSQFFSLISVIFV